MKQGLLANLGRALAACVLCALAASAQASQTEQSIKLSLMTVIFDGTSPTFYALSDPAAIR